MATIPSFELLHLEVHQSLELERYQGTFKKDFSALELETKNHQKKQEEMIDAIFRAFDMDPAACQDALRNLIEWSVFHKALELQTWTSPSKSPMTKPYLMPNGNAFRSSTRRTSAAAPNF